MTRKKIILIITIFALSVITGLYPFLSNYLFDHRKDSLITTYEQQLSGTDTNIDMEFQKATAFNEALASGHVVLQDPFQKDDSLQQKETYLSTLNVNHDSIMGIITIPCIDVRLPIYHGTSEAVLKKGVGHLMGSSLPVGGAGTHAVLTGHTGLSSAKLFSDLTELKTGDYFFITCLNQTLAYTVDQIRVNEPADVSGLAIVPGKDYCTLVTCTPYGVNSHRLFVRGVRTSYKEKAETAITPKKAAASRWMLEYKRSILLCFGLAGTVFLIWFCRQKIRERRERR